MKFIRNFLLFFLLFFLLINFLYDLLIIRNIFDKNQQQTINKYIFPYKNINELEKEIEILQKESNLYRGQKKLFEKAFNDMREEVEYLQPIEEIFEKLISQLDL